MVDAGGLGFVVDAGRGIGAEMLVAEACVCVWKMERLARIQGMRWVQEPHYLHVLHVLYLL